MAKKVVWTLIAAKQRNDILEYWIKRTGNKKYSRKISRIIRDRIRYIIKFNYLGKETDFANVRVAAAGHFSIFYKILETQIIIMSFWDNRQDPHRLIEILR